MAEEKDEKNEEVATEEFGPSLVEEIQMLKEQLKQLSKDELIERLAVYEYVIPKLGPFVQWCINNYYKPIYFRFRIGRENVGLLVGAVLVPEMLILLAEEKVTKYEGGKTYVKYDTRLIHAPIRELAFYDVVLEEGQWEEQESVF
ncbi:MAG TPA: hypothetical protein ENG10_02285 [Candidatus Bathyarchaeota archaeon]|nr:hypothetical protein [Candidatus Bathyarchaeota archaeon]HEX69107.1 hypothetical protein [Candidatus Bathyarchaeota archaeon]